MIIFCEYLFLRFIQTIWKYKNFISKCITFRYFFYSIKIKFIIKNRFIVYQLNNKQIIK